MYIKYLKLPKHQRYKVLQIYGNISNIISIEFISFIQKKPKYVKTSLLPRLQAQTLPDEASPIG